MGLPIEKLEKFGLEDFIKVYRFDLCNRTVNQNQIAAFLQFDADQIATVKSFPANFSKNEHLYELIQRTCPVRNFLEALENTGNEHILKFIKETELSSCSTSTNPNRSQSRGLWFNIPEPIDSFCGRTVFLPQLHDQLKPRDDIETEVTVLSQVKIVSGLGGIGKTETARKYISKYIECYNNFIWISAENESSRRNSFLKLAEEIQIRLLNSEGKSREIQDIVKDIYKKICEGGKSNLIVFDNAEDYQSCKNFFPFALHPNLTKPVILATSRNQEWISEKGEITVLPLDVLTESESLEFLLKQLKIPESDTEEFKEESGEFIELIGGLPLALQQAVAYVKHQKRVNGLVGRPYKLSDYALEFKSSMEKLQSFPLAPDSSTTVFITWDLTLNKIMEDPKGEMACGIIIVMSFLYADKIPTRLLLELVPFPPPRWSLKNWMCSFFQQQHQDSQSTDLAEGLNLLEKFSMIKITGTFVSIHRQVQFLIIQRLVGSHWLHTACDHLMEKCTIVLQKMQSTDTDAEIAPEDTDILLSLYQLLSNCFHFVPLQGEDSLDLIPFMHEFGLLISKTSGETDSLELEDQVESEQQVEDSWGKLKTHLACSGLVLTGLNIVQLKYYESSNLFRVGKYFFEVYTVHRTLTYMCKYPLEHEQVKLVETRKQFQKFLAQLIAQHGENHPLTFQTRNCIPQLQSRISTISLLLSNIHRSEALQLVTASVILTFCIRFTYYEFSKGTRL